MWMDRFPKTDRKKKADMTEWEKAQQGYLYDGSYDQEIVDARTKCADLCYAFNACRPSDVKTQEKVLRSRLRFTVTMAVIFRSGIIFIPITIVLFWMVQR